MDTSNGKKPDSYTQAEFDKEFSAPDPAKFSLSGYLKNKLTCSRKCVGATIESWLPIVTTLRTYKFKEYFLNDILAGLSVGVIHIPQGMGFALLTSLPPLYGLYSSFFPVLVYFFFASSRHNSAGTMSLVSLVIGSLVDRDTPGLVSERCKDYQKNITGNHTLNTMQAGCDEEVLAIKLGLATSATLLMGLIQILMSFLRLGVMTSFMPSTLIAGFTTGAAVHITTSQLIALMGIKVKRFDGIANAPLTWLEIVKNSNEINRADVVAALTCLVILAILKEGINESCKSKMRAPIPAELIVIILATAISHFTGIWEIYSMKVIGEIPRGFQAPSVPALMSFENYIADVFIAAIVGVAISLAMAKTFTQKHGYEIDTNQELLAYGLSNSVSSFFHCFGGAIAPPRTLVHDSVGGKTQVASLFSSLVVLLVILAIGPLFESLPNSVLSAIIIMSLKPLFWQYKKLPYFWKVSKSDFLIWVFTFVAVVGLDIPFGLLAGIFFAMFTVILNTQMAKGSSLGLVKGSRYASAVKYCATVQSDVQIFKFESNLYFATAEKFRSEFFQLIGSPSVHEKALKAIEVSEPYEPHGNIHKDTDNDKTVSNGSMNNYNKTPQTYPLSVIVVDCRAFSYIDVVGMNTLNQIHSQYQRVNIKVVFADLAVQVRERLRRADILQNTDHDIFFPTIQDAVNYYSEDYGMTHL